MDTNKKTVHVVVSKFMFCYNIKLSFSSALMFKFILLLIAETIWLKVELKKLKNK